MRLQSLGQPVLRQPVMYCKICPNATSERKEYCEEHVYKHAYVADLAARLERFEEDVAALRTGKLLPLTSEVVQDMLALLAGGTSVGYLTRHYDLDMDAGDDEKVMRILRKHGYRFKQVGKAWYLV